MWESRISAILKKCTIFFRIRLSLSKYFSTHKHVLCPSTSKLRKSSSILSPSGTRISHSQSKLFAYVSGCWGDENCPVLDVNKPPQPGIPTSTKQKNVGIFYFWRDLLLSQQMIIDFGHAIWKMYVCTLVILGKKLF